MIVLVESFNSRHIQTNRLNHANAVSKVRVVGDL